jgi:hypothetical protein
VNNIYIGGDSFCFDRFSSDCWPNILSNKLNLNLTGMGFAGRGFWRTRIDLLRYLEDDDNRKNTDVFVLCHTDPDRMLSSDYARALVGVPIHVSNISLPYINKVPPNNEEITEMYYKYVYEPPIHTWAMERWFIEINEILLGKTVINLFCFHHSEIISEKLNGYKLNGPLMRRALNEGWNTATDIFVKERLNHFSVNYNIKFANALADYYLNEIVPNPTQTKYFDIDM